MKLKSHTEMETGVTMDKTTDELLKHMWQLLWDFLDMHDFLNGRKGDLTIMPSLILIMASRQRLSMKDIAVTFDVSNSTVTDFVDQLEKKGYAQRARSKEDRRQVFIEVTEKGKDWMRHNRKISHDFLEKRLSKLSPEERETLVSLVSRIIDIDEKSPFIQFCEND